jgi:hypothetical protein
MSAFCCGFCCAVSRQDRLAFKAMGLHNLQLAVPAASLEAAAALLPQCQRLAAGSKQD